jgi:transcription-repair coupling factor (superfamily II helicase)
MLLLSALRKEKDFAPLLEALKKENKPVLVSGVCSALRDLFPAAVMAASGEKALILLSDEAEAARMAKALMPIFPRTLFFPRRDYSLVRVDSSGREFAACRLAVLNRVARGDFDCVVSTVEAVCQSTMPPEVFFRLKKELAVGDCISKEEWIAALTEAGYENTQRVEGPGQYAARGNIIDVFLSGEDYPCRMELFGDEVDSIGRFDPVTQRRTEVLDRLCLTPAEELCFSRGDRETISQYLKEAALQSRPEEKEKRVFIRSLAERMEEGLEYPKDLFLPLIYRFATFLDYLKDEWIFLYGQSDGKEALERSGRLLLEELQALWEENKTLLPPKEIRLQEDFDLFCHRLENRRVLLMEHFFGGKSLLSPSGIFQFRTRSAAVGFRDLSGLEKELESLKEEGFARSVLCENTMAAETLCRSLEEKGIPARIAGEDNEDFSREWVSVLPGNLPCAALIRGGFELADSRFALLTDGAPLPMAKGMRKKRGASVRAKEKILSYTDLAVGDYVVHAGHGIGIFQGVEKMKSAEAA